MADRPPQADPQRLLAAAMRLAAELDQAQLYTAAAFAAMAADAISETVRDGNR